MSNDSARISGVVIHTGPDQQVFRVDPEADVPQSVVVTFTNGKTVTVNADGGLGLDDGRNVTIGADGAIQVSGRKAPRVSGAGKFDVIIAGSQGTQLGDNNTQVNSW